MIRSLIEVMLGEVGRQILYFYEAHALPINLVVLTYGLVMLVSWITLVRIHRQLVFMVAKEIHLRDDLSRKSTKKRVRDEISVPWEEAIKAAPFPLIARTGGLIPYRRTVANAQRFLDEAEITQQALEVLKGKPARQVRPNYRRMVNREIEEISEEGRKK